jgi:flagellar M-ring protein FliF
VNWNILAEYGGGTLPDFLKKTTDKILGYFKGLEKGQRTRFFVFTTLAIVILIAASIFLNQKSYTVLYSGMDPADAGEMLGVLEDMGINAKAEGSNTILVESSQADTVRMQLAAEGYPKSGFNFDIFSNASGLGMTDMEKRVYYQFQLQDNLSKVIKKLDKVDDAVVNISLAQESAFVLSENEKPASASVLLKLKENQFISPGEVRAIAELVAKSVSGLSVDDVRIVDSNMKLYTLEEEDAYSNLGTQLELQQQVKQTLQQQVISLLVPVFGEKSVLAEVNVTLDFDKQTTETVAFSPPVEGSTEGLAVSMKELAETVKGDNAGSVAGIDANGANSTTSYPELTGGEDSVYNKVSRETNLELNETRTNIENAQGRIRDLSVAVVIDSSEMEDDYRENVRSLVANAIGVASDRVSVEMLPFLKLDNASEDQNIVNAFNDQKDMLDIASRASTARLLIMVGAAVLSFVILIVAMLSLRKKSEPVYEAEVGSMFDYTSGEDVFPESISDLLSQQAPPGAISEIKDVQDANLSQLGDYVERRPEAVAQLLRNWLSDEHN